MSYDPYGEERTSTADNREKFGTYTRDNPGQDYADQRYYGVGTGRFNVPDPMGSRGADSGNSASWNQYAYVNGDPVNSTDPGGTRSLFDDAFWQVWGGPSWRGNAAGWKCSSLYG